MLRTRAAYATVFRERMVELVRSGRTREQLAQECKPSAQAMRNWMAQTGHDPGKGTDDL